MHHKLRYAIKNSNLISIDEVEKGLACNCTCPACGSTLIARKGDIKVHHFAHYKADECNRCVETSLHLLAKEILMEELVIKLPALYLDFGKQTYKMKELIFDERSFEFDNVYIEKKIDDIVPDIILEYQGNKLLVEIFVTHNIDDEKLHKIERMGISTLLIDLSEFEIDTSKVLLKDIIINSTEHKKWVYNKKERAIYNRFREKAKPFKRAANGTGNFCPQYLYGWKGESSARWDDCIYCEYCFSINGEVNCLGYSGVSKICDLDNPKLLEEVQNKIKKNEVKSTWLEGTQCKKCRSGYMTSKDGKYGKFLGCTNYPKCKNIIKV